ncbi:MAG: glutathione S-transferase family protein [Pseudomonadota bacterium]
MPKLLYAPASPYSAKIRMAAALHSLKLELQTVSTSDEPDALTSENPLGKIPTLICDDSFAVFDSRAIMQELDRLSGKKLFPRNAEKRREAERLEAAADGLCDALLTQVYERRMRPAEKVHGEWLDYQARKVTRMLDWLNENSGRVSKSPHGGHLALYAALGYADLRFPDLNWSRGRPKLKRLVARLETVFPEITQFRPA